MLESVCFLYGFLGWWAKKVSSFGQPWEHRQSAAKHFRPPRASFIESFCFSHLLDTFTLLILKSSVPLEAGTDSRMATALAVGVGVAAAAFFVRYPPFDPSAAEN